MTESVLVALHFGIDVMTLSDKDISILLLFMIYPCRFDIF